MPEDAAKHRNIHFPSISIPPVYWYKRHFRLRATIPIWVFSDMLPNIGMQPGDITGLLVSWREGNRAALDALLPLIQRELNQIARRHLRRERWRRWTRVRARYWRWNARSRLNGYSSKL